MLKAPSTTEVVMEKRRRWNEPMHAEERNAGGHVGERMGASALSTQANRVWKPSEKGTRAWQRKPHTPPRHISTHYICWPRNFLCYSLCPRQHPQRLLHLPPPAGTVDMFHPPHPRHYPQFEASESLCAKCAQAHLLTPMEPKKNISGDPRCSGTVRDDLHAVVRRHTVVLHAGSARTESTPVHGEAKAKNT